MEPVMLELSGIPPEKKVDGIDQGGEAAFCLSDRGAAADHNRAAGFKEAIITQGGVKTGEISGKHGVKNSSLFLGEVLDLDAVTGGFNLQIAWSTAFAAASSINESI